MLKPKASARGKPKRHWAAAKLLLIGARPQKSTLPSPNGRPDAGARPDYPKQRQHSELRRGTRLAVDALPGNEADGSKGRHREGKQHEPGQQVRGDNCTAPHKRGHARWRYRFAPAPEMMGLEIGRASCRQRVEASVEAASLEA